MTLESSKLSDKINMYDYFSFSVLLASFLYFLLKITGIREVEGFDNCQLCSYDGIRCMKSTFF